MQLLPFTCSSGVTSSQKYSHRNIPLQLNVVETIQQMKLLFSGGAVWEGQSDHLSENTVHNNEKNAKA